jgi:hypothetical protein
MITSNTSEKGLSGIHRFHRINLVLVQWSSGYDFCLTHRRSQVRSLVEPYIFFLAYRLVRLFLMFRAQYAFSNRLKSISLPRFRASYSGFTRRSIMTHDVPPPVDTTSRLAKLRELMKAEDNSVQALVVPSEDQRKSLAISSLWSLISLSCIRL